MAAPLPLPNLVPWDQGGLFLLADRGLERATGVCVAFAGRLGGASAGPYATLNLGGHVQDAVDAVQENRRRLLAALGAEGMPLVVPNQVHGTRIVAIDDASDIEDACAAAAEGADGLLVGVPDVAALLCFADCVPVVAVSPTGRFAVVHAGWRGAVAHIAYQAVRALALRDVQGAGRECAPSEDRLRDVAAAYNVYVGPCIHAECFACGPDVYDRFAEAFGDVAVPKPGHVDLPAAVACDVERAGVDAARVCDAGACTACDTTGRWYSYRASGGVCGRHGAIAFARNEVSPYGN